MGCYWVANARSQCGRGREAKVEVLAPIHRLIHIRIPCVCEFARTHELEVLAPVT